MKKILLFLLLLLCNVQSIFSINGFWIVKRDGTSVPYVLDNTSIEYTQKGIIINNSVEYTFYELKKIYFDDITFRGDVNNDGLVTMSDVSLVVSYKLGNSQVLNDINVSAADVNNDGQISMQDVMFIINKINNGKYPDE